MIRHVLRPAIIAATALLCAGSFAAVDEESFAVVLEIVEERATTGEGRFVVLLPARAAGPPDGPVRPAA